MGNMQKKWKVGKISLKRWLKGLWNIFFSVYPVLHVNTQLMGACFLSWKMRTSQSVTALQQLCRASSTLSRTFARPTIHCCAPSRASTRPTAEQGSLWTISSHGIYATTISSQCGVNIVSAASQILFQPQATFDLTRIWQAACILDRQIWGFLSFCPFLLLSWERVVWWQIDFFAIAGFSKPQISCGLHIWNA